jgi:Tol biopolymer transport system component
MSLTNKSLLVSLLVLGMSACGGGGDGNSGNTGNTQKSSDISYTNASVLGSNVNDPAATDASPVQSANGLELYFHSSRAGGPGFFDVMVSTRATTTVDWGLATNLGATVNSTSRDVAPDLSSDGLTLLFASDRPGGEGDLDLYMSTRATLASAWSTPVNLGMVINTSFVESGPCLSSDELSLYFHSSAPGVGGRDLFVSTRASKSDPWGAPVNLGTTVNSTANDGAPEISSDGLTLYFHSDRDGSPVVHSIMRSTRASITDAWGASTLVPAPVSSASTDVSPSISDDWQTLYFSSNVGGGSLDIWQVSP